MSVRRLNPRLAKTHYSFTVEEVANLFRVHRNTVRQWLRHGLPAVDSRRPTLILGRELAAFLHTRRESRKRTCKTGEIYCVRCREPRRPAGEMADYEPLTATSGNLIGLCPSCGSLIYRRVNRERLDQVRGELAVTLRQASLHIGKRPGLSVNSYLKDDDKGEPNA
jgi:excisionase family DNA binding protein